MIVWRINDVEILLIGFLYKHHRKKDNINLEYNKYDISIQHGVVPEIITFRQSGHRNMLPFDSLIFNILPFDTVVHVILPLDTMVQ